MNTEVRPCPSACCVCMNACEHGRDGCDGDAQTEGTAGRLEARKGHSLLRKKSTERLKLSQFSSVAQLCPTLCDPWAAARQASLSITNSQSLLKLTSIESVIPANQLILCRPLLPPSIFPSIRVFSNESALRIR